MLLQQKTEDWQGVLPLGFQVSSSLAQRIIIISCFTHLLRCLQ
jgi:hypothetical protein